MFESGSASGRLSSVYESLRPGNATSLLEGLQSQLKQRDGELKLDLTAPPFLSKSLSSTNFFISMFR